ncbi:MAG: DUF4129 domain-containing protein [Acidobacteriia bacterium]|nr:DUF4129 domain-containing protein [Terriglobia bacterium]
MKQCFLCRVWLVLALLLPAALCASPGAQESGSADPRAAASVSLDPAAFASELRALGAALSEKNIAEERIAALREALPERWQVANGGRQYEIASAPLRTLLDAAEKDTAQRGARVQEAQEWVATLAAQAEGYAAKEPPEDAAARPMLEKILRRSEFSAVRPPGAFEKFQEWLAAQFQRLLERLFSAVGRHPMGGEILFWLVIAGAVVWLAMLVFRFWMERAQLDELETPQSFAATRTWQEWIRAGRQAAGRGDFREAIHSVYWAGIAHLEDRGALPRERTHTPREYLRLLGQAPGGVPAGPPVQRESLEALTARLERVWYGRRTATPEEFRVSLEQVEALGCRLE